MKHKLVFHFFLQKDYKINRANKIHFECMKRFLNVFDECLFVIAKAENTTDDIVKDFEKNIITIVTAKKCCFKIVENSVYREAKTFKEEIIDKLTEPYDGLVFFAHNKGITNYTQYSMEYVDKWICSLYYLSLNFINEVETDLCGRIYNFQSFFYGSILTQATKEPDDHVFINKNNVFYSGSFYWLNTGALLRYIKHYNISIPNVVDRAYVEAFPGEIFDWESKRLSSHNFKIVFFPKDSSWIDLDRALNFIFSKEEMDEFNNFYTETVKKICNSDNL